MPKLSCREASRFGHGGGFLAAPQQEEPHCGAKPGFQLLGRPSAASFCLHYSERSHLDPPSRQQPHCGVKPGLYLLGRLSAANCLFRPAAANETSPNPHHDNNPSMEYSVISMSCGNVVRDDIA